MPATIGAKLAKPDAPVICITGDGGAQFCLGELGTAMDENTPVIFVIWNNHGYQEIETYMVSNGISAICVTPSPPDFTLIAEAYGMSAEKLTEKTILADVIARAVQIGKPHLIEVVTS